MFDAGSNLVSLSGSLFDAVKDFIIIKILEDGPAETVTGEEACPESFAGPYSLVTNFDAGDGSASGFHVCFAVDVEVGDVVDVVIESGYHG